MIKKLNFEKFSLLEKAHQIQRDAYEVEAELIGSRNIPPLHETIEQLRDSEESFFGFFIGEELVGFIAVENEDGLLRISRLVVSPVNFGKGVGSQLVQYILDHERHGQKIVVSTGEKNLPAKALYEKFGFLQTRIFKIDSILIAEFNYTK